MPAARPRNESNRKLLLALLAYSYMECIAELLCAQLMQALTHVAAMAAASAAAAASPALRRLSVVEIAVVAPSPSGPAPPECSLPLTFFDVLWLTSPPVERVFFYRLAADDDVAAILSGLKESLSRAVLAFYPLAGRLRLTPGTTTSRYELHYKPGDGVTFTVAECDDDDGADVDELATDEPREVARIAPLVPPLTGDEVLAVQATVMARGRGLAVGFAVHHAACDGATSTRFLHTWAAAARGAADAPPPPVIDRSLVSDPRGLYDFFLKAMQAAYEEQGAKMPGDELIATFVLSKEDIQRAKDAVAGEAARRGVAPPPRCSSLVATFGLIWSCYQRAKDEASNGGATPADGPTYLLFPVDYRSRMKPPLPDGYLGNCVSGAFCAAPKGQLAAAGAGGLFTACAAVAAVIEGLGPADAMDELVERMKEAGASGGGMLTVAGSPRFRVYEVDLGFGRPAKVDIVSVAKTGAMAMAESRSGGGGMEVGISLPPGGMQRFQKCFADAIAWLHRPEPCS